MDSSVFALSLILEDLVIGPGDLEVNCGDVGVGLRRFSVKCHMSRSYHKVIRKDSGKILSDTY